VLLALLTTLTPLDILTAPEVFGAKATWKVRLWVALTVAGREGATLDTTKGDCGVMAVTDTDPPLADRVIS